MCKYDLDKKIAANYYSFQDNFVKLFLNNKMISKIFIINKKL